MLALDVVSSNIAMGWMKGTFVRCFQYWLKLCAIGVPALVLVTAAGRGPTGSLSALHQPELTRGTTVRVETSTAFTLNRPAVVQVTGPLDRASRDHTQKHLAALRRVAGAGTVLRFGASQPRRSHR